MHYCHLFFYASIQDASILTKSFLTQLKNICLPSLLLLSHGLLTWLTAGSTCVISRWFKSSSSSLSISSLGSHYFLPLCLSVINSLERSYPGLRYTRFGSDFDSVKFRSEEDEDLGQSTRSGG